MATKLPILYVGPGSKGPDVIRKHNAGFVIDTNNPELFAKTVNDLAKNQKSLKDYADARSRLMALLMSQKKEDEA